MKLLRAQTGFVVPTVIFALVILGVVAVAAISLSGDEQRSARAFRESGLALYSAEAGLRQTLGSWDTAGVRPLRPGDSLVVGAGWTALPNRASYRVVIYKADSNQLQQFVVISQGRRPSQVGGEATITALVTGVPLFKWGLYSAGNISMSGGGSTDGFNSGAGSYAATVDSGGSVATNGSVIMTGGGTIIKGDAAAAGTVSGGAVTGTTTNGAPGFPAQPIPACPAGGYTSNANVPTGSGISYNQGTGVLTVSGGNIITLTAPPSTYYFSQVVLSGGSQLINNGSLNIIIDTKLDLSGGTFANPSGVAATLAVSSCGANTTGWTLSGGSGAYFTIYAPNHAATISGNGDIFGAMVVASYTASGGSRLHYDEGLTLAPSKNLITVVGSWAEVSAF